MKQFLKSPSFSLVAWDLFCLASIIGIWPRFIEPNLILENTISLTLPQLPKELDGLKILQFSDLHLRPDLSDAFLARLTRKILKHQPDIIVFTGDWLCYSHLDDPQRLKLFLNTLHAPFGCYSIFGNHDYAACVSINPNGDYDVLDGTPSSLSVGFKRLFSSIRLTKKITQKAADVPVHEKLIHLLQETPFQNLHNENRLLSIRGAHLNLVGVGEYILGRFHPEKAFKGYDERFPGIILSHNPDTAPALENYPGEIILSGHTHGGQLNLPWLWKKFTLMENMAYKQGLFKLKNKWLYVNRGIGSIMPFRWFAPPELLIVKLKASDGTA